MSDASTSKILHICKVYLPVRGGIQQVVHNISSLLTDNRHSVVTTGKDGAVNEEKIEHAEVIRCRSFGEIASMPIAPSLISTTIKQIKSSQLIALHYPFPLAELALLFTPFITLFKTPPIVVHWHSGIIAQRKLKWLVAPLTWIILIRARAIVITSKRMIPPSFFLRSFRKKIKFIPYGISLITTQTKITNTNQPYYLIIGRHVSYKGIDVAIKAFKQLQSKLIIIGNGPLYNQHIKLTNDLELNDQIKFIQYANDCEVNEFLASSTALIVPSVLENEAFALVQLEAMRLAIPVINTKLQSSVPWVARHLKESITIQPGNVNALVNAIKLLNNDLGLVKRLGENGFKRYQDTFSCERFSISINKLYSSIMSQSK